MLTLAEYARAKCLPGRFLRSLGVYDTNKGLAIRYYNSVFLPTRTRYRHRLTGEPRFSWGEGETIIPYGLWRLTPKAGYVILCEGESDAQTLWLHDFNALGIPGAATWRREWRVYLAPYRRVFIWGEGDGPSNAMIHHVAADWGRVHIIRVPGYKDASELHIANADGFTDIVQEAMKAASPFTMPNGGPARRFWPPRSARSREDTPLADIVTAVERAGVQLRRVGSQLVGLCPFHPDQHPSLSVNPEKNVWFCHAEGVGGGVRQFEERINGNGSR